MELKSLGIIPARYESSRFPGKPLVMINGKTMIRRVYEQASKSNMLSKVIVATDDERIFRHVTEFGGEVMMTSPEHTSGTSRLGEVIANLTKSGDTSFDVVVNIQGDEPFIEPMQIDLALSLFTDTKVGIGTLVMKINNTKDVFNPNVVKVVVDGFYNAMYISRSPIPYFRGLSEENWSGNHEYFRHIGLYAFRTEILSAILELPVASTETAESLEQLRWLINGYKIKTAITDIETIGVDVPDDLLKFSNKS